MVQHDKEIFVESTSEERARNFIGNVMRWINSINSMSNEDSSNKEVGDRDKARSLGSSEESAESATPDPVVHLDKGRGEKWNRK